MFCIDKLKNARLYELRQYLAYFHAYKTNEKQVIFHVKICAEFWLRIFIIVLDKVLMEVVSSKNLRVN